MNREPDPTAERQRRALEQFMLAHQLRPHPWAVKAGVASGAIYAFLKGNTDSLSLPVLQKLAAVPGVPVAALLGEVEAAPNETVQVTHQLRQDVVEALARPSRRRAPVPRGGDAGAVCVAEVRAGSGPLLRDGALLYWTTAPRDPATLIGALCIVDLGDRMVLGDLRRGYGDGRYMVITLGGAVMENVELRAAYPLEWVRPSDIA